MKTQKSLVDKLRSLCIKGSIILATAGAFYTLGALRQRTEPNSKPEIRENIENCKYCEHRYKTLLNDLEQMREGHYSNHKQQYDHCKGCKTWGEQLEKEYEKAKENGTLSRYFPDFQHHHDSGHKLGE